MSGQSVSRTALVLSGGGPVGIAWEAGLIAGLRDGGFDLSRVDCIIGSSAGSIVGAHLALLGSVDELYAAQRQPAATPGRRPSFLRLLAVMQWARFRHRETSEQNRAIARSARHVNAGSETEWRAQIAERLPASAPNAWPEQDLWITATDCATGALTVWTRSSGVPLPLAVASSCAVPVLFPPVHINEDLYMDGGMGSPTNAGLAGGFARVIILDAMARLLGSRAPLQYEVKELEATGSRVLTFALDDASARAGGNLMNISKCGEVAEAGRAQAARWLGTAAPEAEVLESLRI